MTFNKEKDLMSAWLHLLGLGLSIAGTVLLIIRRRRHDALARRQLRHLRRDDDRALCSKLHLSPLLYLR